LHFIFAFFLFTCFFSSEAKKQRLYIIGATCAFDAKIYKNIGGIFDVSACGEGNKKLFQFFNFSFQLPSLLVEIVPLIYDKDTLDFNNQDEKGLARHVFFQYAVN